MTNPSIIYGLMSGTSLDGLDIAACSFLQEKGDWKYEILSCTTLPYDNHWRNKLIQAPTLSGEELVYLDREFGYYLGEMVNRVIEKTNCRPFLISSHGHTIFHAPDKKYSLQIGCGAQIRACTGIPVICDFRSTDIALGGQGAPLVPIGDKLLFSDYDACLNLGGFANISFDNQGVRMAFDICPVNIILNSYANALGKSFDMNGELGRNGFINQELLEDLNSIPYYQSHPPKSLSREWIESECNPILEKHHCSVHDSLRTFYEHIARQIGKIVNENRINNLLLTGGGAHNTLLTEQIQYYCGAEIIIPDEETINFKEALIFAFMGLLRFRGEINCLASVTGASEDSVCGAVYL